MMKAYFDWNATAPLRPEAKAAVVAALEVTGNPSSVHGAGRAARRLVETAREQVAALVGVAARDVVFTSGGTEANMLALAPALGDTLLVSAIEHPSVRSGGRFAAVEEIPVTAAGTVDLAALRRLLEGRTRPLVSLMLANNETGVIQPVAEAAALVHAAGGLLHVDAVQGPGRIACDFKALGADLMTLSSHKIGGPAGRRRADQAGRPARSIRRSRAAARSAARGPAPRMWRASPGSARRRRRSGRAGRPRRPGWRRCGTGSKPALKAVAPEAR